MTSDVAATWSLPGLEPVEATRNRPAGQSWCAWRLVGGNNREVARSARAFPDFREAYRAARYVQQAIDRAIPAVRHDGKANQWAWRVTIDGQTEVTSGRLYQRHRECLFNLQQFLTLMPVAASAYDRVLEPSGVPVGEIGLPELPEQVSEVVDLERLADATLLR